ncbi:deoxyribodipyrimidine photo-lyase [Methylomicrobium sp. Wu6]|uniref:cryptochrome/photolyase family protein n=1 Tax=Methylomicrobium sp. Wu6 TaxID=3107928 RepID=UPI002DD6A127|nr:deoxyribodipyrimidine photo-lyase [Methylomicrobium sp. Wu6]MEC4749329.1 deoxyribodipyrimidine photo-lyase [Methylomicrobium sp. Wu6]
MPRHRLSLLIFRRDLRLEDNCGLNAALQLSERVLPGFIFDPRQIEPHPYQSLPGLRFMLQALTDLQQQCLAAGGELAFFHGGPCGVIRELFAKQKIDAVFINRDYTPFSRRRDDEIAETCRELGIVLHVLPDALLNEPEDAVKNDGMPYKVFTAFYQKARQIPVKLPCALAGSNFMNLDTGVPLEQCVLPDQQEQNMMPGGRSHALALLNQLGRLADYQQSRDYPALDTTSRLSAYLKFGCCSVREAYYAILTQLGGEHPLLRQLYWRDFFTHIAYYFPFVFGRAFVEKFEAVEWDDHSGRFEAWCEGRTGFPIVDAGMRELNETGFMHNRVRMIAASFLVKDLHIDWRWGERYFTRHLVDYDPCVNNGNWQWAASTGCDAQPYFRIFNPWTQQQKFDPDCRYITRWLPELREFPAERLHRWDKKHSVCGYPAPIVDHATECRIAKARFLKASQASRGPIGEQDE